MAITTLNAPIAGTAGAPFPIFSDGTNDYIVGGLAYPTGTNTVQVIDGAHGLPGAAVKG